MSLVTGTRRENPYASIAKNTRWQAPVARILTLALPKTHGDRHPSRESLR